jgi:flagella basal body P-ring formation protein FlgA
MRSMTIFKLFLSLTLAAAALLAQPVVEIASHVVTAGDLAQPAPPFAAVDSATVIAKAPAPGAVRRVNQLQLHRWARTLGIPTDAPNMPDAIVLRRAVRGLAESEIISAVTDSLVASYALAADLITVDILGLVSATVPAGQVTVECLCARLPLNDPTPLRLRWKEPGGRSGVAVIQGLVTVHGEWLEASHDLRTNVALRSGDLVERSGLLPKIESYPALIQLDGSQTIMRPIKSGTPLVSKMLRTVALVTRGDLLELRFDSGSVRLRTAGRTEEPGSIGDLLSFRNIATGQRIVARVIDAQNAHIEATHATR